MTHRIFIAIMTLSFLTLPLLCTAGVAAHACECGENTCCETEEESQCDADPCASMTTARVESDAADAADPVLDATLDGVPVEFTPTGYSPVATVPAPRRLPSAAIVHPIRI
jgi:hypothetical protein